MPPVIAISSFDDPRIADYLNLPDRQLQHRERGLFIAEGELVVRHLLASQYKPRSILAIESAIESLQGAFPHGMEAPVYAAPDDIINQIVGFPMHRGVLAVGERPPESDWRDLALRSTSLLIAEDLTNHDNIGGLFRNTSALGGPSSAILFSPRCADPLYRKSIRVSMGHALRVPFATLTPYPHALAELRAMGFTTIALTPANGAVDINTIDPPRRPALLVGAEGPGLSAATLAAADLRVRIPIATGVDSLNVYVAAAIAMQRLYAKPG